MSDKLSQDLLVEDFGKVRRLTLNRPERLNALSGALAGKLVEALASAAAAPTVGCIVITGSGRAFCAGGDVESLEAAASRDKPNVEAGADLLRTRMEAASLLHEMPKPTIAMLNGVAAGAGMSLALACDLRIASTEGSMTTAFAKVGLSGDFGGSYFLTALVGTSLARELYFTSSRLDAGRLLELRMVNHVVPPEALWEETRKLAHALANGPTLAFRYMKKNLNLALTADLKSVLDAETTGMSRCRQSDDHREGTRAFSEKRAPIFCGT